MAVDPQVARISRTPEFQQLVHERTRFAWILTILMLVVYFGFIGLIAFDKSLLAVKVGGTASLGLFAGVFVILFAFALTGVYVARANTRFDALSEALKRSVAR
ncbi:membrane protein [Methylobacterium radiotolerans]|nr:membrane protein [Methylobacterium radiotolerans]KTS43554.1 membrane protein [Methylobacterium radiotolerans]